MTLNTNVLLFLACMVAGYALFKVGPMLGALTGLGILQIVGLVAIVLFALVILYIGIKVLFNGGWR